MIKSIMLKAAIVILGVLVIFISRGLFYYDGFYKAPQSEMPSYEQIAVPLEPSAEFSDTFKEGEGTILIDLAHNNAFDVNELDVLLLRLISRGLTIEFFKVGEDLEEQLLSKDKVEAAEEQLSEEEEAAEEKEEKEEDLEKKLPVIAFIIVCPQEEFSKEERVSINEFVENGGKLLLIADPTRRGKMNSLSYEFGLIFEPDYLYNVIENDVNYRNILITKFRENDVTKNLNKIALYTAGSISSADSGIAFGDDNTLSSLIETKGDLSPIAIADEANILAIYDLTFLIEPHNGILDNNQFISNVADWLAEAEKVN